jgi:DNA-binding SARP family transcriptional activator
MTTTEIRLLGALSVAHAGEDIPLTGRQLRTIFTLLAASPGATVTTDAIMTSLWPESPPAQARKTVQVYISNLRKEFRDDDSPILSVPGGYSLASAMVRVDVDQFDSLIRRRNLG